MIIPVYILIRTSGRPRFFQRAIESVKKQTYENIQTIVHTDDPRDEYVTGDIIINGSAYGPEYGAGFYNLYCNSLLKAIPDGPGWYHFLDDDDEYASPDVIEKLVKYSKPDHINIGHVRRIMGKGTKLFPAKWGRQKSYQTECFFLHTDHKNKAKWWPHLGGDHNYSKQLTRILPINWIDNIIIAQAQERKGHGRKTDAGNKRIDRSKAFPAKHKVPCLGLVPVKAAAKPLKIAQGEYKLLPYEYAYKLELEGKIKITFAQTRRVKPPVRNIYEMGA